MSEVVEIIRDLTPQIVEVIQDLSPTIVEVVGRGPQGPQGPAGANTIGGYPVVMSNIQAKDVVMFGINEWNNVPQTEIADGGNF